MNHELVAGQYGTVEIDWRVDAVMTRRHDETPKLHENTASSGDNAESAPRVARDRDHANMLRALDL